MNTNIDFRAISDKKLLDIYWKDYADYRDIPPQLTMELAKRLEQQTYKLYGESNHGENE